MFYVKWEGLQALGKDIDMYVKARVALARAKQIVCYFISFALLINKSFQSIFRR